MLNSAGMNVNFDETITFRKEDQGFMPFFS